MKLTTIVLATAFALSGTAAMAQQAGTSGYGSTVAPSVGSYAWPSVGTRSPSTVPTWSNTFNTPTSPSVSTPAPSTIAPMGRGRVSRAPSMGRVSGLRR
jgi:hypothetical protein